MGVAYRMRIGVSVNSMFEKIHMRGKGLCPMASPVPVHTGYRQKVSASGDYVAHYRLTNYHLQRDKRGQHPGGLIEGEYRGDGDC